jgi:hypothetical protein
MNDAGHMPNLKHFDELWDIEKPKIEATYQECDMMVTHVSPSIKPEHIPNKHYRMDDSTSFFTFDGQKLINAVLANTTEMYGSLQGIAGNAISHIKALELTYGDDE